MIGPTGKDSRHVYLKTHTQHISSFRELLLQLLLGPQSTQAPLKLHLSSTQARRRPKLRQATEPKTTWLPHDDRKRRWD